jgi:hypothetical protein
MRNVHKLFALQSLSYKIAMVLPELMITHALVVGIFSLVGSNFLMKSVCLEELLHARSLYEEFCLLRYMPCSPLKVSRRFGEAYRKSATKLNSRQLLYLDFLLGVYFDREDGGEISSET